MGDHWTVSAGDFRAPGSLFESLFSNIFTPEITARGLRVQARNRDTEYAFFAGEETLSAGPRVPYRILAPQTVTGATVVSRIAKNLRVGGRFMETLVQPAVHGGQPQPVSRGTRYQPGGHGIRASDLHPSQASQTVRRIVVPHGGQGDILGRRRRLGKTRNLTVRVNYVAQGALYFPLVGYFAGDRRGPFHAV